MRNAIHFLSGLPRTGSTLLGSILNQNPAIRATATSPLFQVLAVLNAHVNELQSQHEIKPETVERLYRNTVEAFHPKSVNRPIVFDKHRSWPGRVESIREFITPKPRIVCTVRPIAEIVASYITLADGDPQNFIDRELRDSGASITNEARANFIWSTCLAMPYSSLDSGLKLHPETILLIEYDHLVYSPVKTMRRIYDFCEIKPFAHDFNSIEATCSEPSDFDGFGLRGLHDIRSSVSKVSKSPNRLMPSHVIDYFAQFDIRC